MAETTETPLWHENEPAKVESWRLHILLEAGYPVHLAERPPDRDAQAAEPRHRRGVHHDLLEIRGPRDVLVERMAPVDLHDVHGDELQGALPGEVDAPQVMRVLQLGAAAGEQLEIKADASDEAVLAAWKPLEGKLHLAPAKPKRKEKA